MSDNLKTLLIIIAVLLFLSLFAIDYVDLERFKECYYNDFQDERCERYLEGDKKE